MCVRVCVLGLLLFIPIESLSSSTSYDGVMSNDDDDDIPLENVDDFSVRGATKRKEARLSS